MKGEKVTIKAEAAVETFPIKSILRRHQKIEDSIQLMRGGIFGDRELDLEPDEEILEITRKANDLIVDGCDIVVENQREYDDAGKLKDLCMEVLKEFDENIDPGREYLHALWKESIEIKKELKIQLEYLVLTIKESRNQWLTAFEAEKARINRLAEIEAKRLQKEADDKAAAKAAELRENNQEAKAVKVEEKAEAKVFIPYIQKEKETGWTWNTYNFDIQKFLYEALSPTGKIKGFDFSSIKINISEIKRHAKIVGEGIYKWGIVKKEQK